MCGRKKRDPRIDEEQKKARADAEAVKLQAETAKEEERKKLLAMEKEKAMTEDDRLAMLLKTGRRGGIKGRSLLQTTKGGAGYFSRFS
tara:strand:+ start:397 stop:660 length:264 start_codon:yes stop_codon:yes gene_type:complete